MPARTRNQAYAQARKPRRTEEDDILRAVIELCEYLGFLVFHDEDSRRNRRGLPDLLIAGYGVFLALELKTDRNDLSPEQRAWLNALTAAGIDARLYRVSSWKTGGLAKELRAIRREWMARHATPNPRVPRTDVRGIAQRHAEFARNRTVDSAVALADEVPGLIRMINYLTGQLETARIAAGVGSPDDRPGGSIPRTPDLLDAS